MDEATSLLLLPLLFLGVEEEELDPEEGAVEAAVAVAVEGVVVVVVEETTGAVGPGSLGSSEDLLDSASLPSVLLTASERTANGLAVGSSGEALAALGLASTRKSCAPPLPERRGDGVSAWVEAGRVGGGPSATLEASEGGGGGEEAGPASESLPLSFPLERLRRGLALAGAGEPAFSA